ncbi:MAG TPA: hypothetical protein VFV66_07165 [Nonomuraea sp.]|nr:hypothetical protein [Nonomuraea sp.]
MARGDGGGRDGRGEPEWRPVADVDMMTAVVLEQLGANRDQLRTLEPARRAPHLLDDHTVGRIKQVFGQQRDDLWLWVETGERWQAQDLTAAEAAKVDQYVAAVEAFAASNTVILAQAARAGFPLQQHRLSAGDGRLGAAGALRRFRGRLLRRLRDGADRARGGATPRPTCRPTSTTTGTCTTRP